MVNSNTLNPLPNKDDNSIYNSPLHNNYKKEAQKAKNAEIKKTTTSKNIDKTENVKASAGMGAVESKMSMSASVDHVDNLDNANVVNANNVLKATAALPSKNLTKAQIEKLSQSVQDTLHDLTSDINIVENKVYSMVAALSSDRALAQSSLNKISQDELTKSIANSKKQISNMQKQIYDKAHQPWWKKVLSFFKKIVDKITNVFSEIINAVLPSSIASKVTGWMGALNKKLLGFMDKIITTVLKKMGASAKVIGAVIDIANMAAVAGEMMIPGFQDIAMITGNISLTAAMPGGKLLTAIAKGGAQASKYCKDTLKDPKLAEQMAIGNAVLGAVVGIAAGIATACLTGGAGAEEAVSNITKAVDEIEEGSKDIENMTNAANDISDGAEGAEGSEGEASESSAATSSGGESTLSKLEDCEEELNNAISDSVNSKAKAAFKSFKNIISKLKSFTGDAKKLEKAANKLMGVAALIDGAANISSGVSSLKFSSMKQDLASLQKDDAAVRGLMSQADSMSSQGSSDISRITVMSKEMMSQIQDLSQSIKSQTQAFGDAAKALSK